jgi:hypothetical protein
MKMLNFFIEFAVCFDAIALGQGWCSEHSAQGGSGMWNKKKLLHTACVTAMQPI